MLLRKLILDLINFYFLFLFYFYFFRKINNTHFKGKKIKIVFNFNIKKLNNKDF